MITRFCIYLEDRLAFQPQAASNFRSRMHSSGAIKSMETQKHAHVHLTWEAQAVKLLNFKGLVISQRDLKPDLELMAEKMSHWSSAACWTESGEGM